MNTDSSKLEKFSKKLLGVGNEPTFTKTPTKLEMIRALNYYSVAHDMPDSKKWALTYLTKTGQADLKSKVSSVKHTFFGNIGFRCRMITRGAVFTPEMLATLNRDIEGLLQYIEEEKPTVSINPQPKPPTQEKPNTLLTTIDDLEDQVLLGKIQPTKLHINPTAKKDIPLAVSLCEERLADINENPEDYRVKSRNLLKKFYTEVLKTLSISDVKPERKPRAKKPVSAEKQVKNVQVSIRSEEFGINGQEAVKIPGSTEILLFNTKYRRIHYLFSESPVTVKGKSIIGYDPEKSWAKTVRKPEEFFREWNQKKTIPIVSLLAKANKLTSKPSTASHRLSEAVIILAVRAKK